MTRARYIIFIILTILSLNCPKISAQIRCTDFGTASGQARCLLNTREGTLPYTFWVLLDGSVSNLTGIMRSDLKQGGEELITSYLKEVGKTSRIPGGPIEKSIQAHYFVVHTLHPSVDPYHALDKSADYSFHVLIGSSGVLYSRVDFVDPSLVTRLFDRVKLSSIPSNYFINVGLFSRGEDQEIHTLGLLYVIASLRAGRWLIPAMHGSLESRYSGEVTDSKFLLLWSESVKYWVKQLVFDPPDFGERARQVYESYIRVKLLDHEKQFKASVDSIKQVEKKLPNGQTVLGYSAKETKQIFINTKTNLINELSSKEYAGLRDYIDRYFPSVESIPVTTAINRKTSSSKRAGIRSRHAIIQEAIILPPDLSNAATAVISFFSRLQRNKRPVDLKVFSTPEGATVTLVAGGKKIREADTNTIISNVVRGIYTYTFKRQGFSPITKEINLVDERATSINCTLKEKEEGPCTMR